MKVLKSLILLLMLAAMLIGCENPANNNASKDTVPNGPGIPSSGTTAPLVPLDVQLPRTMEIFVNRDNVHLKCSYYVSQASYEAGDTVTVNVAMKNLGGKIPYTGVIEDQIGAASLIAENTETPFEIHAELSDCTDLAADGEFAHHEILHFSYSFIIPQNAPVSNYIFNFSVFGVQVKFDANAVDEKYLPCLWDLPEEAHRIIWGSEVYNELYNQNENYEKDAKNMYIYGEFDDVYVLFPSTWHNEMPTHEKVNGLLFQYPSSTQLHVFTPDGRYTLGEAFESGILSAEQIQEIYDNYTA